MNTRIVLLILLSIIQITNNMSHNVSIQIDYGFQDDFSDASGWEVFRSTFKSDGQKGILIISSNQSNGYIRSLSHSINISIFDYPKIQIRVTNFTGEKWALMIGNGSTPNNYVFIVDSTGTYVEILPPIVTGFIQKIFIYSYGKGGDILELDYIRLSSANKTDAESFMYQAKQDLQWPLMKYFLNIISLPRQARNEFLSGEELYSLGYYNEAISHFILCSNIMIQIRLQLSKYLQLPITIGVSLIISLIFTIAFVIIKNSDQ